MNECDWHILVISDERIKSHCLTRTVCYHMCYHMIP